MQLPTKNISTFLVGFSIYCKHFYCVNNCNAVGQETVELSGMINTFLILFKKYTHSTVINQSIIVKVNGMILTFLLLIKTCTNDKKDCEKCLFSESIFFLSHIMISTKTVTSFPI